MRGDNTESCHDKSRQVADCLTHLPVSHQSAAGREGDSNETNQLLGDRDFSWFQLLIILGRKGMGDPIIIIFNILI